jgi:fructan beta-fructosidase
MVASTDKVYYFFLSSLLVFCSCNRPETPSHEKYRPQVHFSPSANWMDGPAGLVFSDGEYHLFYRYNTEGTENNPRHWGHAVSPDLIRWNELPVALSPEGEGATGYGSVVVDAHNTSGLGTAGNPPLVAIYTYTNYSEDANGPSQRLAYSTDKGNTWITYGENPVIANPGIRDFHDPQVFWYEPSGHWVMVVAVEGRIRLYTSPDLKEWAYASEFGTGLDTEDNIWERPDLFELPVVNGDGTQWILTVNVGLGSYQEWMTGFFAGEFDGKTFTSTQTTPYGTDYGKDNYGGLTFNNLPNGRRVLIGWMNNWEYAGSVPASPWRGSFTIPRDLHLEKTPYYCILASRPVKERTVLYGKTTVISDLEVVQDIRSEGLADVTSKIRFPLLPSELTVRFRTGNRQIGSAEKFGIKLSNREGEYILAGYDAYHQQFYIDRTHSTSLAFPEKYAGIHIQRYPNDGSDILEMQLILDVASLELFAMDGKVALTDAFYPTSDFDRIAVFAENGRIPVEKLSITQLQSILKNNF